MQSCTQYLALSLKWFCLATFITHTQRDLPQVEEVELIIDFELQSMETEKNNWISGGAHEQFELIWIKIMQNYSIIFWLSEMNSKSSKKWKNNFYNALNSKNEKRKKKTNERAAKKNDDHTFI